MRPKSRRAVLRAASAGVAAGLAGCGIGGVGGIGDASPAEQARSHRDALSRFEDVARAIEEGYRMSTPYVRSGAGVMGLPFFNFEVPELDPENPAVLFYDLLEDGTYELLGVEWLVPAESTDAPPTMFGRDLSGPTPGETAFIPEHYGLHAWLFAENPDGLFARYHAGVDPPSFIADLETAWDTFLPYYANGAKAESEGGYTNTETCIATAEGGYGVPFANTGRVGTALREPPILLYRLTSTWNYQLMGAEWYVPADSTDAPPTMFGRTFHDPEDGHSPDVDQGRHYGLHAWLFTANPRGLFAPYNPVIEC